MTPSASSPVLAGFIAAAAAASDADVLANAALNGPLGTLGAERVAIYVASADGTRLHMVGHSGGDEVRHLYSTLPIDESTPHGLVFTTGTELFVSLPEATRLFPVLAAAAAVYASSTDVQFAAMPVRHAGEVVGVLGVLFSATLARSWESKETLDATCGVIGLWSAAHRGELRSRTTDQAPILTPRQRAVLRLAAHGLTNAQIAAQLGFAESTVKADLTQLYRLTGAVSRQDLLDRTCDLT